jgi:hypothetical protein
MISRTIAVRKTDMNKKLSGVIALFIMLPVIFAGCDSILNSEYKLTVTCAPSEGGLVSPGSGTYKSGSQVTLVANAAKNFKFSGWAGDTSELNNRVSIRMNSNKNIVATFVKIQFNLQLNVNSMNSGTLDIKSGLYEAGNQLRITASPSAGYRFDHWGGSTIGESNPLVLAMDGDKSITAFFVKQYKLDMTVIPSNGGTVTPTTGTYDEGTQVKLTAVQVFPYIFDSWQCPDVVGENPTTLLMNSDKNVTCKFITVATPDWQTQSGIVWRGGTTSVPIELNQSDYIEGEVVQSTFRIYIQSPTGETIIDFGYVEQTNFLVTAQVTGRYNIVLQKDGNSIGEKGDFVIKYRIYSKNNR